MQYLVEAIPIFADVARIGKKFDGLNSRRYHSPLGIEKRSLDGSQEPSGNRQQLFRSARRSVITVAGLFCFWSIANWNNRGRLMSNTDELARFLLRPALALALVTTFALPHARAGQLYYASNGLSTSFIGTYDIANSEFGDPLPARNPLIGGLAYDRSTDTLFAYDSYDKLGKIDRATGAFVPIGTDINLLIGPIAIQPGTFDLFGLSLHGDLYKIDKQTGTPTIVGSDQETIEFAHALAFSPDGSLYAADAFLLSIAKIDPTSGKAVRVPMQAQSTISGLAFDSNGVLYAVDSNIASLVTLDPVTGQKAIVRDGGFGQRTIAFVVPEPGLVQLLNCVAIALLVHSRRRSSG
ncbi:MAG: hypothetical protein AB7G28_03790 [Pirellulales bacterium]